MIILETAHPNDLADWRFVDEFSTMPFAKEALRSPSFETFDGMLVRLRKSRKTKYVGTQYKDAFVGVIRDQDVIDVSAGSKFQTGEWTFNDNSKRFAESLSLPEAWSACRNASWMLWVIGYTLPLERLIQWMCIEFNALPKQNIPLFKRALQFVKDGHLSEPKKSGRLLDKLVAYQSINRIQEEHRLALKRLINLNSDDKYVKTVAPSSALAGIAIAVMYDNNDVVVDMMDRDVRLDSDVNYALTQLNFAHSLRDEFSLYDVTSNLIKP